MVCFRLGTPRTESLHVAADENRPISPRPGLADALPAGSSSPLERVAWRLSRRRIRVQPHRAGRLFARHVPFASRVHMDAAGALDQRRRNCHRHRLDCGVCDPLGHTPDLARSAFQAAVRPARSADCRRKQPQRYAGRFLGAALRAGLAGACRKRHIFPALLFRSLSTLRTLPANLKSWVLAVVT